MVYDYNACMTYIHNDNIKIRADGGENDHGNEYISPFLYNNIHFSSKGSVFSSRESVEKKKHLKKKMCFTVVLISSVFSRDMERSLENPESILDVEGYSQIILWK